MFRLSCWKRVFEALGIARKIPLMATKQAQDTSNYDVMNYCVWLEVCCLWLVEEESGTREDFTE